MFEASWEVRLARRKRVLLVDDEQSIALVLRGVIEDLGYEARAAYSGEEALEILKGWNVDLLITDIKMPEMDGFELLRTLQKDDKNAGMKYVILTAYNDIQAIQKAKKEFGIEYYITKPFDLNTLEAAVDNLMKAIPV